MWIIQFTYVPSLRNQTQICNNYDVCEFFESYKNSWRTYKTTIIKKKRNLKWKIWEKQDIALTCRLSIVQVVC